MRVVLMAALCLALVGCTKTGVAEKALGPGAVAVNPDHRYRLEAPGIYRINSNGSITEICQNDMEEQRALQEIRTEQEQYEDTIEDAQDLTNVTITVPIVGGNLRLPYVRYRVEGYTVTTAVAPTGEDLADYVIRNVADTCRETVLPKAPFLVVSREGRATKAYIVSRGLYEGSGSYGVVGWTVEGAQQVSPPIPNVTFALEGDQR